MRFHLALCAITLSGSALVAQTLQQFDLYPGVTSFSSRGSLRTDPGELLQGVHDSSFRGVLEVQGRCRIAQFRIVTQDQNCATRERFDFVVRAGTDAAGPDGTAAGLLGEVIGIDLPMSNTNGACAWTVTTTLTVAAAIPVPADAHWSYGVRLDVGGAANWVQDGQSVHATAGDTVTNEHRSHDRSEDQAWELVGASTIAGHPSAKRSWRIAVSSRGGAVLNLRCGGRKGYGGTFPIASTASAPVAWDARIDGGRNNAGFTTLVVVGVDRSLDVPLGFGANLYVPGPYFLFPGRPADSAGVSIVPMLPFVPAGMANAGTGYAQGAIGNAVWLKLTNVQSITP